MTRLYKVISLTLLIILLTACGRDKEAEATVTPQPAAPAAVAEATATLPPQATAVPADQAPADLALATGNDPQSIVLNAMHAQTSGSPYRATTSVDAGGAVTEMKTEVIPPNTMHIVIGGGNLELILIEGVLWSKNNGAEWKKMGSPEMMQSIFDSIQNQIDADHLSAVTYVGKEPVLGVPTDIYTFTTTLGEGAETITSNVKLWIAEESGLPVRMESNGSAGGISTHTIQSIEYDPTITITAPAQ